MRFKKIIKEEVVPSEIEGLDGPEEVISYLGDMGVDYRKESTSGNDVLIINEGRHVVEFEGKFPIVSTLEEFIREKTRIQEFTEFTGVDWREHWTEEFWSMVGKISEYNNLYHATTRENEESILKNGIRPTNETRIPTSKIRRPAVFAVKDLGFLEGGVYGEVIFSIDATRMKKDGVTPLVGREKGWERRDRAMHLKDELNLFGPVREIIEAGQGGSWRGTVVIYGKVPPKYVSKI